MVPVVLNMYGSHRLMCLNTWPIGSEIIKNCGLRVGVALLEEVCLCGGRICRFPMFKLHCGTQSLLPSY